MLESGNPGTTVETNYPLQGVIEEQLPMGNREMASPMVTEEPIPDTKRLHVP